MVKIILTKREIDLLEMCYKVLNMPLNYSIQGQCVVIVENEKEKLYDMVNCVLDVFLKLGLLESSEPNELGFELEKLNEKINHEYVILNSK